MWNNRPPPVNPPMPSQPPPMQQNDGSNVAWNQTAPPTDPNVAAYYSQMQMGQMTPEQYKQWETYYQQYNAWYAQYGEQYAKMQVGVAPPANPYQTTSTSTTYPGMPVTAPVYPQPPLPQENQPPPPLPSEPPSGSGYVAAKAGPVKYQQQQQQQPYQSNLSKWGHKPQVKVNQRVQYGGNQANNYNNNNMRQQNNRWSEGGFNQQTFTNGQGNIPPNRIVYQNNSQQMMNQPPPPMPKNQPPLPKNPDPNEPSEEEKFFDDQFKKWEEEFNCWKKQNANHPDRKAYAEYEKKFTDVRAKLLERREQMRRKKRAEQGNSQSVQIKNEPLEEVPREAPLQSTWQPEPISNRMNELLKPETIFPIASSGGSIPGLGFGEDEIKQEPVEESDTGTKQKPAQTTPGKTKPLLDLSEDIQNAPQSNDLMEQLNLLLENSQVSALLTLVNLTNVHPNNIQLNALKPIIDALKQLTSKSDREILKALAEVSMKLNHQEPDPEEYEESPPQQQPYVHVAAAGITVIPPINQPEPLMQGFPDMSQQPPWQQNFDNSRNDWNWQQQQPPPPVWNQPPPLMRQEELTPTPINNIQERLMGLSQPPQSNEGMFARRNEMREFVEFGQNSGSNRNSSNSRDGFVEFGTPQSQTNVNNFRNMPENRNQRNFMGNNKQNQRNTRNNNNFTMGEQLDYGESNPTYPGKWVLISERPPLIRRTKRGKRKNRKGQIIESKKWPGKSESPAGQTKGPVQVPNSSANSDNGIKEKQLPIQEKPPDVVKNPEEIPKVTALDTVVPTYGAYPQTTTLRFHKTTISLDDILLEPGRLTRPNKIVIIMRGPPGSGKSVLARLIKDQEGVIGGTSPRILSIDDYYTVEEEKEEIDPITGKKMTKVESKYEYEPGKEDDYMQYLLRSFKKNITDNLFNFIIVDAWNEKLHQYFEIHDMATKHGYVAYTIELLYALDVCLDHNVHNRSTSDIKNMIINWKSLPPKHILLDATNLIQFSMNEAMELAGNVQTEQNPNEEPTKTNSGEASNEATTDKETPIDTPMDSIQVDLADDQESEDNNDEVEETGFFKSKWEDDATDNKLARLDGVSKPMRHATIEDYLQIDGWEPPKTSTNGKKRVRWADIEARREQEKMQQIGFVVGHTDWNKMMDPTQGSSALCDIKYIEKAPKFRKLD